MLHRKMNTFIDGRLGPTLPLLLVLFMAGCTDDSAIEPPQFLLLAEVASAGSAEPHLATTADGAVVMSWLEPSEHGTDLRWSVLQGGQWVEPRTIASGENWFVNWADFPSVEPIDNELWAAHWLVKRPGGTYALSLIHI